MLEHIIVTFIVFIGSLTEFTRLYTLNPALYNA